jgi:hypothetical protein
MASLFQQLELEAFRAGINPRTEESRNWFRAKAQRLTRVNRMNLMNSEEVKLVNKSQGLIGSMNMFFYDPKHKDTLPFYDRFPLTIISGPAEGGFYGMNLHYLPPVLRAKFLGALMEVTNNDKFDDTTKFKARYEMINKIKTLRYYKPCYKHYLFAHIKSRLARVPAPEWEVATFLPTASWEKGSASDVYKVSRGMI